MKKTLLLVDFENVQKLDISLLDDNYSAIIFVGATQKEPKLKGVHPDSKTRFTRVDFLKIDGNGKNALDFHIAFHLGRTFERSPSTKCIVLSRDKGFDPLLRHLNNRGFVCERVDTFDDICTRKTNASKPSAPVQEETICAKCKKASTIEHNGGRWCTNCGSFATPPDPALTAKLVSSHRPRNAPFVELVERQQAYERLPTCDYCGQKSDMIGGIYDDGEWMCGFCIARYAK